MSTPTRQPARKLLARAAMGEKQLRPYVELFDERRECIARLSSKDARELVSDIAQQAARAEADAMILRFFKRENFPDAAAEAITEDFRVYRSELDGTIGKRHEVIE